MVKGQRAEMFCTLPDKCMELQGFLDEGLFVKSTTITDYGTGVVNYEPDSGSEALVVGTPVVQVAGKDRTYAKAEDNCFIAVIRADPTGHVPVTENDELREALLQFITPSLDYHIPLSDDNKAIVAGDYVGWTGTKWDKLDKAEGVVLVAKEAATANSGKYIDAYCSMILPASTKADAGAGG